MDKEVSKERSKERSKEVSAVNQEKIINWVKAKQDALNLQEWKGYIKFGRCDEEDSFAEVRVDAEYLRYYIIICTKSCQEYIDEGDIEGIKRCLTHELVHLIIDPLYLEGIDSQTNQTKPYLDMIREQTVQRITRLLCN